MRDEPIALFGPARQLETQEEVPVAAEQEPSHVWPWGETPQDPPPTGVLSGYPGEICQGIRLLFGNAMCDLERRRLSSYEHSPQGLSRLLQSLGIQVRTAPLQQDVASGLVIWDLRDQEICLDRLEADPRFVVFAHRRAVMPPSVKTYQNTGVLSDESQEIRDTAPPRPEPEAITTQAEGTSQPGSVEDHAPGSFYLHTRLIDHSGRSLARLPFVVQVDGQVIEGETGSDGEIRVDLPRFFQEGSLSLRFSQEDDQAMVWPLRPTALSDPASVQGIRDRLHFLGFSTEGRGEQFDLGLAKALAAFQARLGWETCDGALDERTREQIIGAAGPESEMNWKQGEKDARSVSGRTY